MIRIARDLDRLPAPESASDGDRILQWLAEATAGSAIPPPLAFDAGQPYTRTLLHKNERFELLALHWQPGTLTSLHDHGGKQCWFAVVGGSMTVENYRRVDAGTTQGHARLSRLGEMLLDPGAIDYRGDDADVHRCIAVERTTTLHLYAAPLGIYHVFDERNDTCAETTSAYDAIVSV
jgi:predicted metal-dependent enzyme (double-stranded beta helix superfamily)